MQLIFSRNADIDKIAFLNWRINGDQILNLLNMADGYLTSAIQLAERAIANNGDKSADITIFPILTNANHGIELYLKAITWLLNTLMKSTDRIEGSHNIKQIYKTVRTKIKKYGGEVSIEHFDTETDNLRQYIDELFGKIEAGKDDNMDFSRYPINTKYKPHFYVLEVGNVEIDLENFLERFKDIHLKLENLSDFLYYHELMGDD